MSGFGPISGIGGKVFSLALCAALAGCNIHPTPFGFVDGSPVKDLTVEIVKRVRCETRDALLGEAARLLQSRVEYTNFGETTALLASLKNPPLKSDERDIWDIHPLAQIRTTFFLGSKVKLDFNLMITETNTNSLSVGISPTSGPHVFKLGIGNVNANLTRKNERKFDLPATKFSEFEYLECDYDLSPRSKKAAQRSDWSYPIRGNINLAANVRTFVEFTLLGISPDRRHQLAAKSLAKSLNKLNYVKLNEAASDAKNEIIYADAVKKTVEMANRIRTCDAGSSACISDRICYNNILLDAVNSYNLELYDNFVASPPAINDILTFTTDVNGGINPNITFANGARSFQLAGLGINIKPGRSDVHKLTINLEAREKYIPPTTDPVEVKIGGNISHSLIMRYPANTTLNTTSIKGCPSARNLAKKGGRNIVSPIPSSNLVIKSSDTEVPSGPYLKTILNKGELERTNQRARSLITKRALQEINEKLDQ